MYIEVNDKREWVIKGYYWVQTRHIEFQVNVWDIQLLLDSEPNICYPLANNKRQKVINNGKKKGKRRKIIELLAHQNK